MPRTMDRGAATFCTPITSLAPSRDQATTAVRGNTLKRMCYIKRGQSGKRCIVYYIIQDRYTKKNKKLLVWHNHKYLDMAT